MTLRIQTLSNAAITFALVLTSAQAWAIGASDDCHDDSDCGVGAICEKEQWTMGCSASPEGEANDCDTTAYESETGTCYAPPEQCQTDDECGEYLSCAEVKQGVCFSNSDGTSGCTEEPSEFYCGFEQTICEEDSECPRDFDCVGVAKICLDIACPEGEPDCGGCSGGSEVSECQPKQIDCEGDSQCPSDWSCFDTVAYECSGSGSGGMAAPGPHELPVDPDGQGEGNSGSGDGESSSDSSTDQTGTSGDSGEGADSEPLRPGGDVDEPGARGDAEEEVCTETKQMGTCYPDELMNQDFGGRFSTSAGANESAVAKEGQVSAEADDVGGENAPTDADGNVEEGGGNDDGMESAGGGCSVSPSNSSSGSWLLGLLFLVPGLRRRLRSLGS